MYKKNERKMQDNDREKLLGHLQSYSTLFRVCGWVLTLCTSPYGSINTFFEGSTAGSASGVVSVYFTNLSSNEYRRMPLVDEGMQCVKVHHYILQLPSQL